jgi:hypothetical protein
MQEHFPASAMDGGHAENAGAIFGARLCMRAGGRYVERSS